MTAARNYNYSKPLSKLLLDGPVDVSFDSNSAKIASFVDFVAPGILVIVGFV